MSRANENTAKAMTGGSPALDSVREIEDLRERIETAQQLNDRGSPVPEVFTRQALTELRAIADRAPVWPPTPQCLIAVASAALAWLAHDVGDEDTLEYCLTWSGRLGESDAMRHAASARMRAYVCVTRVEVLRAMRRRDDAVTAAATALEIATTSDDPFFAELVPEYEQRLCRARLVISTEERRDVDALIAAGELDGAVDRARGMMLAAQQRFEVEPGDEDARWAYIRGLSFFDVTCEQCGFDDPALRIGPVERLVGFFDDLPWVDPRVRAGALNDYADYLVRLGRSAQALPPIEQALAIVLPLRARADALEVVRYVSRTRAEVLWERGRGGEAIDEIDRTIAIALEAIEAGVDLREDLAEAQALAARYRATAPAGVSWGRR